MAHICVYGGGFMAVAAACKAAREAPNYQAVLVVPYPYSPKWSVENAWNTLGGIGTIGGQNYWDDAPNWPSNISPKTHLGTWDYWAYVQPSFYSPSSMAQTLMDNIKGIQDSQGNLFVQYGYDIVQVEVITNPRRIDHVNFRGVTKDSNGKVIWDNRYLTEFANIFIDASEDGRLSRLSGVELITGRHDWSKSFLTSEEQNSQSENDKVALQQAATLMFKVRYMTSGNNVMTDGGRTFPSGRTRFKYYAKHEKFEGLEDKNAITTFNKKYCKEGYMLKPFNAAHIGDSDDIWMNCLVVFNVDGRYHNRDIGTNNAPNNRLNGQKTTDDAWYSAREFLHEHKKEIEDALSILDGCQGIKILVIADDLKPAVGEMLYIRETVHCVKSIGNAKNGSEDTNCEITRKESFYAGENKNTGDDTSNFNNRIGLGFYDADVHPYGYKDYVKNENATKYEFIYGRQSYHKMRNDMEFGQDLLNPPHIPPNPVYMPYNVLCSNTVANILIPGYAACISSFSWGEIRVFPNLCVLGDAAGVTAGHCIKENQMPLYLNNLNVVQQKLRDVNARLWKQPNEDVSIAVNQVAIDKYMDDSILEIEESDI